MFHQVPENARLEVKFVASELQCPNLLHWLRLNPAGFVVPFPDRQVNNVYFDTHQHSAFAENLSGVSCRTKARYRWYGESLQPDAGALEIKCKRNQFGWKLRYSVSCAPNGDGAEDWRGIRRALTEQLPPDGKKWLAANPLPVMINRYWRKYFLSSDRKIRATVDTHLRVWDQRYRPRPNVHFRVNIPHILVVEFKFDRRDRDVASEIVRDIPLRLGRHSKYVTGFLSMTGG